MAIDTIAPKLVAMQPPTEAVVVSTGIGRTKRGEGRGRGSGPGRSKILVAGDLAYVDLGDGVFTVIDAEDIPTINKARWHKRESVNSRTMYAGTNQQKRHLGTLLHRRLLGAPQYMSVDHINGNGLDNRKSNLRLCTHAQNMKNQSRQSSNTTGYRGVSFCSRTGRFIAQIWLDNKHIWLGRHDTAEEAHAAYVKAATELHREFARP